MSEQNPDILVSGGGIAGLCCAILMGRAGFDVICVDPVPPVTDATADGADMRSTALLQPAREALDQAGLWDDLAGHATPLQVMQIMDVATTPPKTRAFDASDVSDLPFGWNVPNWLLRRAFLAAAEAEPKVQFRAGVGLATLTARSAEALVTLTDGTQMRPRLVIGADGRASPTRKAAGIGVKTTRFGQKALAFAVTHPIPHNNVSTEIHDTGGPFTLVPLPDRDGRPASAIVWMDRGPAAQAAYDMDVPAFEAAMSDRSQHILGPLTLASRRSIWPIISQLADRLDGPRVALVAEAAHVVPPIGAQGLNMSLSDITTLRDLALEAPDQLGAPDMLRRYHSARYADLATRVAGITTLNRASMAGGPLMRQVRATAMAALHDIAPLRRAAMQMGLGKWKLG